MISEPLQGGTSIIHRIDPRIRVLTGTIQCAFIAVADDMVTLGVAFIFACAMLGVSGIHSGHVMKRLIPLAGFLLMMWMVLPWTGAGDILGHLGVIPIRRTGTMLAALITMKAITILFTFTALIATLNPAVLGNALALMGLPAQLIHLLLISYRYIFVIEQEYQRLITAIRIRNFRPGTDMHTYRTIAYLIGMLFVRAAERARRVHWAMVCRGFTGRFFCLQEFPPTPLNAAAIICMGMIWVGLAYLEWVK